MYNNYTFMNVEDFGDSISFYFNQREERLKDRSDDVPLEQIETKKKYKDFNYIAQKKLLPHISVIPEISASIFAMMVAEDNITFKECRNQGALILGPVAIFKTKYVSSHGGVSIQVRVVIGLLHCNFTSSNWEGETLEYM